VLNGKFEGKDLLWGEEVVSIVDANRRRGLTQDTIRVSMPGLRERKIFVRKMGAEEMKACVGDANVRLNEGNKPTAIAPTMVKSLACIYRIPGKGRP